VNATETSVEVIVPTLFRFVFALAVLASLGFAAMYALATLVHPDAREIIASVPLD
jgi:hypothetical protein